MKKYKIEITLEGYVEAENEEDAIEQAYSLYPDLCQDVEIVEVEDE